MLKTKKQPTHFQFRALSLHEIKNVAEICRAVKHPFRVKMLNLMHMNKRMTVTNLYTTLKVVQPVISQQLAILRKVGAVTTERNGKEIYYSVNYSFFMKHIEIYLQFNKN